MATLKVERGGRSRRVQQGVLAAYEWLLDGEVVKRRPDGTVAWPAAAPLPSGSASVQFHARQPPSTVHIRVFGSRLRKDGSPVGPDAVLVDCSSSADQDCVHLDRDGFGEVRFAWREPGARHVVVFATWYVPESLSSQQDRGDEIKELSASWLFRVS